MVESQLFPAKHEKRRLVASALNLDWYSRLLAIFKRTVSSNLHDLITSPLCPAQLAVLQTKSYQNANMHHSVSAIDHLRRSSWWWCLLLSSDTSQWKLDLLTVDLLFGLFWFVQSGLLA